MGYPQQPGQPWQQPQQGYGPPAGPGYGPPPVQGGYASQGNTSYAPGAPAGGGGYNFGDLWTGADKTAGELIPVGDYDAVVEEAPFGQTRDGDKGAWTIKFRITTGPAAGRPVTMTMSISPTKKDGTPNPAGMGIMFRQLHAMGVPVPPPIGAPGERPFWELGWTEHNVAQQMTGKPVLIKVIQNDWDGGTNNKIRDIKPARPGAPTQVQQSQPQAPAMGGYQPGPVAQGYAPPQAQQAPNSYGQPQWQNPAGQPAQGPPQQAPQGPYGAPPGSFPGQASPQGTPQGPPSPPQQVPPGQAPAGPPAQPPWAQQAPQSGAPPMQQPGPAPAPQQAPGQGAIPTVPPGQAPPAPPWAQQ
jgi:hypothetical protein